MKYDVMYDSGSFLVVVICVSLYAFIFFTRSFDHKLRRKFILMLAALLIAVIAFVVDDYLAASPITNNYRYLAKIIKFICEGFIELEVVLAISGTIANKTKLLYSLPFVITSTLICTAPFHNYIFYIDANNNYIKGIFGNLIYLEGSIYALIALWICAGKWRNGYKHNASIIMTMILIVVISVVLEEEDIFHNSILSTAAVAIIFLYMYMYAERYNVDSVSKCFKRRCFYSDGKKHARHDMAVISMDLNDLKFINDNYGHKAGDIALLTFAEVCRASKTNKFILYRTGGDEFMILGIKATKDEAEELVEIIKKRLKETPYSSSFGIAMYRPGNDFDDIVVKADQAMYKDKKEYKRSLTKRSHSREDDDELFETAPEKVKTNFVTE